MDDSTIKIQGGTLETAKDAGEGKEGIVTRWLMELELADKLEKKWREDGKKVKEIYRNKNRKKNSFNILWANTEVLRPNLYSSTPRPDVRRRYRDADPVGKIVAEILERTLAFEVDTGDFDDIMNDVVFDMVLPGRGVARVCLDATYDEVEPDRLDTQDKGDDSSKEFDYQAPAQPSQDGQPAQPPAPQKMLQHAKVYLELVPWNRFRRGPADTWDNVPWIAYEHALTKTEIENKFSGFGSKVNYDFIVDGAEDGEAEKEPTIFKRVRVWEILDKEERETIWIAPSYKEMPLLIESDKLKLKGFFDCPEPIYSIDDSTSLVPVCEYFQYEEQAKELNNVTTRINKLIDGLKIRGIYDSTITEMQALAAADDNELIPSDNSTAALSAGGMDKAIWMMPLQEIALVLKQLYMQRDQVKNTIYEIAGISDIMRGQSNPDETLGAQELKSNNGAIRLQRRQKKVQRFARDLMRIMAEIIAEHYQPEFLNAVSGYPVTPQIMEVMRRDLVRGIHVDIETDSTIAADLAADRRDITDMMQGVGGFVQNFTPVVESGVITIDAARTILLAIMRRAKLGREVEDALEQNQMQPVPPKPDPDAAQRQVDAQQKAAELQQKDKDTAINAKLKNQELEITAQGKQADFALKSQELSAKSQAEQGRIAVDATKIQHETARKAAELKQAAIDKQKDRELQVLLKKMELDSNEKMARERLATEQAQHIQRMQFDQSMAAQSNTNNNDKGNDLQD